MIKVEDLLTIKQWLVECNLDHSDEEFYDLIDRFQPLKMMKPYKPPVTDVVELEAAFLDSDGNEPELIAGYRSFEHAMIVGRFFCAKNDIDVSEEVLVECVERLREQL